MAKVYRKRPVEVEAVRWTGENFWEIDAWAAESGSKRSIEADVASSVLVISTLEGVMKANVGDWIMRGVSGEFYPCKPDIFEKTYEPVLEFVCTVCGAVDPPRTKEGTDQWWHDTAGDELCGLVVERHLDRRP